jgi:hypothetical protein
MMPTVPGGSLLRVDALAGGPRRGELVAFVPTAGPLLCCHRAIATREDGAVLTQGDKHQAPDGWLRNDQVVGVVRSFRLGGKQFDLDRDPSVRPSRYRVERQRLTRMYERALSRLRVPVTGA